MCNSFCNECHRPTCADTIHQYRCQCSTPDYSNLGCATMPELSCIFLKKDYPCLNLRKGQTLADLMDSLEISKCLQGCDCNAPINFIVTFEPLGLSAIDKYQANMTWYASIGATGYTVEYKACSDSAWTTHVVNQTGTTNSTLQIDVSCYPEKCFDFRVKAICRSCQSGYNTLTNQILVECTPPFNLCWHVDDSTLTWESSPNQLSADFLIGFKKYDDPSFTFASLTVTETGSGSYSVDLSSIPFVADYKYDFYVSNDCGSTSTVSSNVDDCESTNCVVPVQSIPTITDITDTLATVNWPAIIGITGYTIQVDNITTSTVFLNTIHVGVTNMYNLSGLSMGNTYNVTVGYLCDDTESCNTQSIEFTTTGTDCSNPQNLAVTGNGVLTWTPSVTGFTTAQRAYYRQKTIGGSFLTTGFSPANDLTTVANTASISGLTDNVVYEFQVANLCVTGGPNYNSNGIKEAIKFACVTPTQSHTNTTATGTVSSLPSDITKVRFTLYNGAASTILQGPVDIATSAGAASKVFSGLITATAYTIVVQLIAMIDGTEQMSSFGTSCNITLTTS